MRARENIRGAAGRGGAAALARSAGLAVCTVPGGCEREKRQFQAPAPAANITQQVRLSTLQPGVPLPQVRGKNGYEENAYALNEGKTLFSAFNCLGCHGKNGGGGMGPPLMDDKGRYGSEPEQIYLTILQGRPNGMPSFAGKLTEDQTWKLAAYVRSLAGLARTDAAPGRDDNLQAGDPENTRERKKPSGSGGIPGSAEHPE
jgi:cytochrome c oxidase cbb3-type subunit 3